MSPLTNFFNIDDNTAGSPLPLEPLYPLDEDADEEWGGEDTAETGLSGEADPLLGGSGDDCPLGHGIGDC